MGLLVLVCLVYHVQMANVRSSLCCMCELLKSSVGYILRVPVPPLCKERVTSNRLSRFRYSLCLWLISAVRVLAGLRQDTVVNMRVVFFRWACTGATRGVFPFSRAVQFSYYINNRQPNGSLSNVLSELN